MTARDLHPGITAYIGGRYRELAAVGADTDGRVLVVTVCTRGYLLEPEQPVRTRATDRSLAA